MCFGGGHRGCIGDNVRWRPWSAIPTLAQAHRGGDHAHVSALDDARTNIVSPSPSYVILYKKTTQTKEGGVAPE